MAPTDSTSTSQPSANMNGPLQVMSMVSVWLATRALTMRQGTNWITEPVRRSKAGQKRF